jgi:hypothetical protein
VVAADWSGARHGERRHLWLAEVFDGRVVAVTPHARAEVVRRCITLAEDNPGLIVGLDFSFSVPVWWAEACGIVEVAELWADEGRLERWLSDCLPPFWGRPGRRRPDLRPDQHWRLTELATRPRPRSVFQIGGVGSVGTASLRGMPFLAALRGAGFSVWPFDQWRLPAVVEAWPRLAIGSTVKSSAPARRAWLERHQPGLAEPIRRVASDRPDAFDAVASAGDLWRRRHQVRPGPSDRTVLLEGWIDGVPMPAQRSDGGSAAS